MTIWLWLLVLVPPPVPQGHPVIVDYYQTLAGCVRGVEENAYKYRVAHPDMKPAAMPVWACAHVEE